MTQKDATSKKALTALFMVVFMDLFGFGLVIPLLPQIASAYAGQDTAMAMAGLLGDTPPEWWLNTCQYFFANKGTVTGWLMGLFSLMQFLFSPLWGAASDRLGRKPLLTIGMFGHAFGHALFALSTGFGAFALFWMYISRIVTGFAGANLPVAMAYIADHTEAEERAKGMGLIGAAFGLGFIIGPAISGVMAEHLGWGAPFWLAAGTSFISAIFTQMVLVESDPTKRLEYAKKRSNRWDMLSVAWKTPGLKGALMLFFIVMFGFANLEISFVLFSKDKLGLGKADVGLLLGFAGLVIAFTQGLAIGKLRQRYSEVFLIRAGMVLMAGALILIPFAQPLYEGKSALFSLPLWLPLILVGIFFIAFGNGITNPSLSAFLSRKTPEETQGGILGAAQSLSSLARVLGPICAGVVFDKVGHQRTFWVGAMIMVVGVAVGIFLMHDSGPESDAGKA